MAFIFCYTFELPKTYLKLYLCGTCTEQGETMILVQAASLFHRIGASHAFHHPEAKDAYCDALIGFMTATLDSPDVPEELLMTQL